MPTHTVSSQISLERTVSGYHNISMMSQEKLIIYLPQRKVFERLGPWLGPCPAASG